MYAGLGVILLVAGAILAFAVNDTLDGVDLVAIGWILIAGGGLALAIGAIQGLGWMNARSTRMRTERQVSSDGGTVVEETRTD